MRTKQFLYLLTLAGAMLLAPALDAQVWTAVASTGTVDEASLGNFAFGANPTSFGYLAGSPSTAPIVARYNVTDTSGIERPAWNTLELGYLENAPGALVTAQLFQVNPCTGQRVLLCGVSSLDSPAPNCVRCTFNNQIDFGQFLYYVEVTVSRNNAGLNPIANTLRIY